MNNKLRAALIALLVTTATAAIVILSPLLLLAVEHVYGERDWQTLSNIGQSYTGIATVLSLLAFLGVVYSVTLQTRQNVSQQQQASRQMQFELYGQAMRERGLAKLFTPTGHLSPEAHDTFAERVYMNLILRYLEYSYTVGNISKDALRVTLDDIFTARRFRESWREAASTWRNEASIKPEKEFVQIADECCGRRE